MGGVRCECEVGECDVSVRWESGWCEVGGVSVRWESVRCECEVGEWEL